MRFLPGLKNTAGGWSHQRCPWGCIRICILPWLVFMSQHRFVDSAFCSKRKYGTPHFQGVGTKIGRIWELDGISWSSSADGLHSPSMVSSVNHVWPTIFSCPVYLPSPYLVASCVAILHCDHSEIPQRKSGKYRFFTSPPPATERPSNSASWDSETFLARSLPAA